MYVRPFGERRSLKYFVLFYFIVFFLLSIFRLEFEDIVTEGPGLWLRECLRTPVILLTRVIRGVVPVPLVKIPVQIYPVTFGILDLSPILSPHPIGGPTVLVAIGVQKINYTLFGVRFSF